MTQQARAEETRARLLKAAQECFATRGYDATGVAEICQRAGVSKGAFYHHFPTKQSVFMELLQSWLGGLEGELGAARARAKTVPEALLLMARVLPAVFRAAGDQLPIFLEFWTQAAHDPLVWQATIEPFRRYQAFFARLIEEGVADGSLPAQDADVTAHVLVAFAVGLVLEGLLDPQATHWGEVATQGIKMILQRAEKRER